MKELLKDVKTVSPGRLMEMNFMFVVSRVLGTAIELDLFLKIHEGINDIASLTKEVNASKRGVHILLNALSGMGLVEERNKKWFLLDEAETFLVKGSPSYLGGVLAFHDTMWDSWKNLTQIVKSGKPVVAAESDENNGKFFSEFVEHLFALNYPAAKKLGEHLGIGTKLASPHVLDVGAGSGVWGIAQAERNAGVMITAQDREPILDITRRMVDMRKLSGQFRYLPGNFRDVNFGENIYGLIILGHICHSEGEAYTKKLFHKSMQALKPGGVLAIAEMVPDTQRKKQLFPLLFGVNMLMHTEDGDVFTFEEYASWLKEAGFARIEELEAPSVSPLILAYR